MWSPRRELDGLCLGRLPAAPPRRALNPPRRRPRRRPGLGAAGDRTKRPPAAVLHILMAFRLAQTRVVIALAIDVVPLTPSVPFLRLPGVVFTSDTAPSKRPTAFYSARCTRCNRSPGVRSRADTSEPFFCAGFAFALADHASAKRPPRPYTEFCRPSSWALAFADQEKEKIHTRL